MYEARCANSALLTSETWSLHSVTDSFATTWLAFRIGEATSMHDIWIERKLFIIPVHITNAAI